MHKCIIIGNNHIGRQFAQHFRKQDHFQQIINIDYSFQTEKREDFSKELHSHTAADWIFDLTRLINDTIPSDHEFQHDEGDKARVLHNWIISNECNNLFIAYHKKNQEIENIYSDWLNKEKGRRLIIARCGLLYGPELPGYVNDLIKTICNGCCIIAGSPGSEIFLGYITGFLSSLDLTMNQRQDLIRYDYCDQPVRNLSEIVNSIRHHFDARSPVLFLPYGLAGPVHLACRKFGVGCVYPPANRVLFDKGKLSPQYLKDSGFEFKFDFEYALTHWETTTPEDIAAESLQKDIKSNRTADSKIEEKIRG